MINNRVRKFLIVSSGLVAIFLAIGVLFGQSDDKDKLYRKFDIFVEVMNRIRRDYVEPVDPSTIFDGALKGMAGMLDAESSYLTADEYARYQQEMSQRRYKPGIDVVKVNNNYALVVKIRGDSPAAKSGLRRGDYIRAVDDVSTRELPIIMINALLSGQEDSSVKLSVLRTGTQGLLTFDVPRAELADEKVEYKVENETGFITIPNFKPNILEDVQRACEEFTRAGLKNVVLDIRNNVNGDFEEAIHVAELFTSGGALVSLKSKSSNTEYVSNEFSFDFTLHVLADESTGRAAEVFALALKERGAAELVGRNTIGIGTVQKDIIMDDGAFLRISYATIVGAEGAELHGKGVAPNVTVEKNADENGEDTILLKAIELIKSSKLDQAA